MSFLSGSLFPLKILACGYRLSPGGQVHTLGLSGRIMAPGAAYPIRYVVPSVAKRHGIGGCWIGIEIEDIPGDIHPAHVRHSNA